MEIWVYAVVGFVCWLIMAGFGAWVAAQKEREPWEGAILGLLFGPFGVLIEALLPAPKPDRSRPLRRDEGYRYDTSDDAEDRQALDFLNELGDDRPPSSPPVTRS